MPDAVFRLTPVVLSRTGRAVIRAGALRGVPPAFRAAKDIPAAALRRGLAATVCARRAHEKGQGRIAATPAFHSFLSV